MRTRTTTKKEMCEKLGLEYLGKGVSSNGDDGIIVRKIGATDYISIGETVAAAYDRLIEMLEEKMEE